MKVWKCKLIFPTDTLQQKIEITDLKPFLAAENTSVLIILATAVAHSTSVFKGLYIIANNEEKKMNEIFPSVAVWYLF